MIIDKNELSIELTNACNLKCDYCSKYWWNRFFDINLFSNVIADLTKKYINYFDLMRAFTSS